MMDEQQKNKQMEQNRVIRLAEELRALTLGICRVGPGPYGFGVSTKGISKVGAVVCMAPDPYGEEPLPDSVTEYTFTVRPTDHENGSASFGKVISRERLLELAEGGDIVTRAVAKGLLQLAGKPVVASKQEDIDAFDRMADDEINGRGDSFTADEARQLSELRWYESKTPKEIVDFQLFEDRLCMPFEVFHTAAELALNRQIEPDELRSRRFELQLEYRAVCYGIVTPGAPDPQGPRKAILGYLKYKAGNPEDWRWAIPHEELMGDEEKLLAVEKEVRFNALSQYYPGELSSALDRIAGVAPEPEARQEPGMEMTTPGL